MTIRGIEHIGITVADLAGAERFFIEALDASVLYRIVPSGAADNAISGDQMTRLNGFPPEMRVTGLAMLRFGNGCNIELFEIDPGVADAPGNISQAGLNHLSVYVDDIQQAGARVKAQGATLFDGPSDCFAHEEGRGNQTWFCRTPFGLLIELISLPSPLRYDAQAQQTRWIPQR